MYGDKPTSRQIQIIDAKIKTIIEKVDELQHIAALSVPAGVSESTGRLATTRADALIDQMQQYERSRNRLVG